VYSLGPLVAPDLFPPQMRDEHGAIGIYFEAAAVIVVLVLLGQVLELRARERTSGAIRALLDLSQRVPLSTMQRSARSRISGWKISSL